MGLVKALQIKKAASSLPWVDHAQVVKKDFHAGMLDWPRAIYCQNLQKGTIDDSGDLEGFLEEKVFPEGKEGVKDSLIKKSGVVLGDMHVYVRSKDDKITIYYVKKLENAEDEADE